MRVALLMMKHTYTHICNGTIVFTYAYVFMCIIYVFRYYISVYSFKQVNAESLAFRIQAKYLKANLCTHTHIQIYKHIYGKYVQHKLCQITFGEFPQISANEINDHLSFSLIFKAQKYLLDIVEFYVIFKNYVFAPTFLLHSKYLFSL